jgi:hypothetical protein
MNILIDLLSCKLCSQQLKDSPIVLSCCGETICQSHLNDPKLAEAGCVDENNNLASYECELCHCRHDMSNKTFPINKMVESMLKLATGQTADKAKQKCHKLRKILNEVNKLIQSPGCFVFDHTAELKRIVDLRREELKLKIDEQSIEMIQRLDLFRKDCNENLRRLDTVEKLASCETLHEATSRELNDWMDQLNTFETIDERKLNEILSRASLLEKQFQSCLIGLRQNLTLNQVWLFEPNTKFSKDFGKELRSIESKYSINFETSKFSLNDNQKSPSLTFGDFSWNVTTHKEVGNDGELYLKICLNCESLEKEKYFLIANVFYTLLHLNDASKNCSSSKRESFFNRQEDIDNLAREKAEINDFILIKDLMNTENGYYDLKNDTIKLRIDFNFY